MDNLVRYRNTVISISFNELILTLRTMASDIRLKPEADTQIRTQQQILLQSSQFDCSFTEAEYSHTCGCLSYTVQLYRVFLFWFQDGKNRTWL
jgi:hypothetical protein